MLKPTELDEETSYDLFAGIFQVLRNFLVGRVVKLLSLSRGPFAEFKIFYKMVAPHLDQALEKLEHD